MRLGNSRTGDWRFLPRDPIPPGAIKVDHWTPEQIEAHMCRLNKCKYKPGVPMQVSVQEPKTKTEEQPMKETPKLFDLSKFEKVVPSRSNLRNAMTASVNKSGLLYLSNAFVQRVAGLKVSIYLSPDGRALAIIPGSDGEYQMPEKKLTGWPDGYRRGAKPLVHMAQARGLSLPAQYELSWEEGLQGYLGRLIEISATEGA